MATTWIRSRIALVALVLSASLACATGTFGQVPPEKMSGQATSIDLNSLPARSFRLLSDVLARTERVATFRFDRPCFECRVRSLTVKDIITSIVPVPLSEERAASVKKLLSQEDSFILSLAKSCPALYATEGLVLYQPGAVAIFLVYPTCQAARLILEKESPPYLFNVDPIYSYLTLLQQQPR